MNGVGQTTPNQETPPPKGTASLGPGPPRFPGASLGACPVLRVSAFWARVAGAPCKVVLGARGPRGGYPPAQRITKHPRKRGRFRLRAQARVSAARPGAATEMPASFEPKCLRISSRRVPPGSDPHARPPKSPPPSPEALRSTVDSGRAGRAGAEISPRPRRRGRPAGVAIPPPESNFPPGGAPGRGLSSAPGRGLSSAGAPGRGLSVCPRIPGHGTRIPNPGARSQAAATIPYSMAYLVPSPHRTTAYSTYYGHASVAHHRMYHRQHHRQQSAPSSPTSPSFRSHFGASMLAPARLTAYCARGRAARAPAARAHSVETATTRKRLD